MLTFEEWAAQAERWSQLEQATTHVQQLATIPSSSGSPRDRLATLLKIRATWRVPTNSTAPADDVGYRVRDLYGSDGEGANLGRAVGNLAYAIDTEIARLLDEAAGEYGCLTPELIRTADFPTAGLHFFDSYNPGQLMVVGNVSFFGPGHRYRHLVSVDDYYYLPNGPGLVLGAAVGRYPVTNLADVRTMRFYWTDSVVRLTAEWAAGQRNQRQREKTEAEQRETDRRTAKILNDYAKDAVEAVAQLKRDKKRTVR